ncbi:MAG: hypothetical protein AAGD01_01995 [Acidobacteriota bacterium]
MTSGLLEEGPLSISRFHPVGHHLAMTKFGMQLRNEIWVVIPGAQQGQQYVGWEATATTNIQNLKRLLGSCRFYLGFRE